MTRPPCRVLVVGQTPPPYHGQAIMVERLVNATMEDVHIHHVRMAFSGNMDQVGRIKFGKLIHLVHVIWQIIYQRFSYRAQILFYPPAGPNRVPMWRDIVILTCTRWLFPKTVFHMHASGLSELYPRLGVVGRWLFRWAYFRPDAVIRISEFTSNDAQVLKARREFIVPNCADDEWDRFEAQRKRARSGDDKPIVFMYLGTVCRTKGILVLVDACRTLRESGIDFRLDVVGSYWPLEFEDTVRSAIAEAGLDNHVRLYGQLTGDDKLAKLSSCDVFCFPSFFECEAFPCVLLEAMSFGKPVVSTQWRGIRSIVDDDSTGCLVEVENSPALASAMKRLYLDRDLRLAMGERGREKFLRRYTVEQHVRSMAAALVAVASNQPSRLDCEIGLSRKPRKMPDLLSKTD